MKTDPSKENIFFTDKKLFRQTTIGKKTFLITFVFGLLLGALTITIGYLMYSRSADRFYAKSAQRTGDNVSVLINNEDAALLRDAALSVYYSMIDELGEDEEQNDIIYERIRKKGEEEVRNRYREEITGMEDVFRAITESTVEDDYVYYVTYDEERENMVFIVDIYDPAHTEDYFPCCTVWPVSRHNAELMVDPSKNGFVSYSTGGGMVISNFCPVYDDNGSEIGYIGVDTTLDEVLKNKHTFLLWYCLVIGTLVLIISYAMMRILRKMIVLPITRLERGGREYIERSGTELVDAPRYFANLNLHTGDEIEMLWHTMADLEIDIAVSMRKIKRMAAEKERIEAELSVARMIQDSMLPKIFPAFPERQEFDLYAKMVPAKEVGGDLYDFFLIDDDHLVIVIGDVSGKGISAALFMVMTKDLIRSRAMTESPDPAEILTAINASLMEENSARMFVTVWLGILTISTGYLVFADAGHEYPAIKRAGGDFTCQKDIHSAPVAARKKTVFKDNRMFMRPGDTLYLYTDGVTEACDREKEMFTRQRMLSALNGEDNPALKELDDRVRGSIEEFAGEAEQFDDITTLCFRYFGNEAESLGGSIEIGAVSENLPKVTDLINNALKGLSVSPKELSQILIIAEELFINIASYAYPEGGGSVAVRAFSSVNENSLVLSFTDSGAPFNPLSAEEPDITAGIGKRKKGGLGVFYVRKKVDDIVYEYEDNKNILTVRKVFER